MLEHACRLGLEGIVSKRVDMPYRSGRGEHWLKSKSVLRQEFIIIGYVPSTVSPGSVGALALGYHENGKLMYAGRVGTGYSHKQARELRESLEKIAGPRPALGNALPAGAEKGVRWVKPQLVCEVEFHDWTTDRLIRQSSFKGLREDKTPEEVVLETRPESAPVVVSRANFPASARVRSSSFTERFSSGEATTASACLTMSRIPPIRSPSGKEASWSRKAVAERAISSRPVPGSAGNSG